MFILKKTALSSGLKKVASDIKASIKSSHCVYLWKGHSFQFDLYKAFNVMVNLKAALLF